MRSVEMIDERLAELARETAWDLRADQPFIAELLGHLARYVDELRLRPEFDFDEAEDTASAVMDAMEAAVDDAKELLTQAVESARGLVGA